MIRIQRECDIPSILRSAEVNAAKIGLAARVSRGEVILSGHFNKKYWQNQEVKGALYDSQHGKCCFCENLRARKWEFDAEHFRPKARIHEEPTHPGYWWLPYEWSNLFYACVICNRGYKKNHFPINGTRAFSPADNLESEDALLVNPIDENPEDCIGFDWQRGSGKWVTARGINFRGRKTIEIVGLNRPELQEERAEDLKNLIIMVEFIKLAQDTDQQDMVLYAGAKIQDMTSSKRRFSAFKRAFFRDQGLGDHVADN